MARFTTEQLGALAAKIKNNDPRINSAAAAAVNKTATYTSNLSVSFIKKEVALTDGYLRGKIRTTKRASPDNLEAVITASTRNTLLTRYPYRRTLTGVRVKINANGGFEEIPRAFLVSNLKGSGATGIAVSNKQAIEIFRKGKMTPKRRRKLQRIIAKARTNKHGITVLNSRSINQLFTSVREDVQPQSVRFMRGEFIEQLERKGL